MVHRLSRRGIGRSLIAAGAAGLLGARQSRQRGPGYTLVEAAPAPPTPPYRPPFEGEPGPSTWFISQWYGNTTFAYRVRGQVYDEGQGVHFGLDFAVPCNTPVRAIATGQVIAVDGDYGSAPHNVVIEHPDGNQSVYGHLLERSHDVVIGQHVEPGQVVGRSGDSTARPMCDGSPHLHLEVRRGGRMVATNPVLWIAADWEAAAISSRFQIDLDHPRRWQSIYDQPDIRFGGPLLNDYRHAWPP